MSSFGLARQLWRIDWDPGDRITQELLTEVLSYPGVPAQWQDRDMQSHTSPMLTFVFRKDDQELRFFSTWTTFGAPHDVTLEEVRIESSFPADDTAAKLWEGIVSRQ